MFYYIPPLKDAYRDQTSMGVFLHVKRKECGAMAVRRIYESNQADEKIQEWQMEDGDKEPILKDENTGSTLYDTDNKKGYVWHIDHWKKVFG